VKEALGSNQILRLLFWETTIKCNLTCVHCRRLESDEAAFKDLSTAQAEGLISQLAELGKKQPMMPVLVGTLIDATMAEQIRDSGIVRVAVSLDGATAEVHDKLRQLEGSFERALRGVKYLREKEMPVQINITLTRHNAGQLEDIYELAKSVGAIAVHVFMLVPVGCGQVLAETDMLSPEQYEQKMLEICRLDGRSELQMKVTCGPHYERIIRQQGLYQARKKTSHISGSVPGRRCFAGMPCRPWCAVRRSSGRRISLRVFAGEMW
jgi:MoaA/NifB/PqqE/SkfB family radical SAM enzyme